MKQKNIQICVSHRIDLESALVPNPLYQPVLCGSVFLKGKTPPGFMRDDVGDNISERRMTFCEVTIQYWMWKNLQLDYYGLCHYRRYLAFHAPKKTVQNEYGHFIGNYPTRQAQKRYGLLDERAMRMKIASCDILAARPAEVQKLHTPYGIKETVREHWAAHDDFIKPELLDLVLQLVDERAPQYSQSAREYYESQKVWGFNCYVMCKKAFDELCSFEFPILFELEKRLDTTGYTQNQRRSPGFASEILYGIFLYHHSKTGDYKIETVPLVYFEETEANASALKIGWFALKHRAIRWINFKLLPYGSSRRKWLKQCLLSLHIVQSKK